MICCEKKKKKKKNCLAYLNKLEVPDLEEPDDDGNDHETIDDSIVDVDQQDSNQMKAFLLINKLITTITSSRIPSKKYHPIDSIKL